MKKLVGAVLFGAFVFVTVTVAFAQSEKCTIDEVEGDKVTMTCEDTKLTAGTTVTVRVPRKIEGC